MSVILLSGRGARVGRGKPILAVESASLTFAATAGGSDPATQSVRVRNASRTGSLTGPVLAPVAYQSGGTGWLASASYDPDTRLVTVGVAVAGLSAGDHIATIPVADGAGGTVVLTITFTVSAAASPTIVLETTTRNFNATEGGADPGPQTVTITNGGTGTLATCVPTVTDGSGGPATWLVATVSGSGNSQLLTLTPTTGALTAATYPYSVSLASAGASNTPQVVSGAFTVAAAGGSVVSVASAVQRFDGGSGSVLVCCGFPLRPGDLTQSQHDAQQVRVLVGGVEQAVATTALLGRHTDGSLRSIGVQFQHTIPDASPITAEVRLGETRTTTDLAWTTPVEAMVHNSTDQGPVATIRATDLDYLCGTFVTLEPLVPAVHESPVVAGTMQTRLDAIWNTASVSTGSGSVTGIQNANVGQAQGMGSPTTYDNPIALWAAWARTGTVDYYQYAYRRARWQQTPFIPSTGTTGAAIANPEGLTGVSDPRPAEQHCIQLWGMLSHYWLSAWAQPLRIIAYQLNNKTGTFSTSAGVSDANNGAVDDVYHQRFNLAQRWGPLLPGYIGGLRIAIPTNGGWPGRLNNYVNELGWVLSRLESAKQASPAYRAGLVNTASTVTDLGGTGSMPNGPGNSPCFQLAWGAQYLMRWWLFIDRDPRIPGWLQTMGDLLIAQYRLCDGREDSRYAAAGAYGCPYWLTPDVSVVSGVRPYEMPLFAALWAWLYAYTGNATYKTWAERGIDERQTRTSFLTWNWKVFAEVYATGQGAAYWLNGGAADCGLAAPTVANPATSTGLV